eukprot:scaffold35185_cov62-Phaeocystis_antarctica.AAC.6
MPKSSSFTTSLVASPLVHESKGLSTPGVRENLTKLPPCTFIMGSLPTVTALVSAAVGAAVGAGGRSCSAWYPSALSEQ